MAASAYAGLPGGLPARAFLGALAGRTTRVRPIRWREVNPTPLPRFLRVGLAPPPTQFGFHRGGRGAVLPHIPMHSTPFRILSAGALLCALAAAKAEGDLGIFNDQGDIGAVSKPGSGVYDPAHGTYTVGASGANMWFKEDAMRFVWKKVSGDVSIAADIEFAGASAQAHRKACLVIRQNLDPGSAYVDVARHGDGLTSLQFRDAQGGTTKEIQSNVAAPRRVRLDRLGTPSTVGVECRGGAASVGASFTLHVADPFYVGLAVCAHDDKAFETAVFSRVELGAASPAAAAPQPGLRIITLPSGDQRVADR